jgi:hypothetical protein
MMRKTPVHVPLSTMEHRSTGISRSKNLTTALNLSG